ncbi:hypothetical protein ACFU5I_20260, partial [Streptomyces libani]
MGGTKRRPYGSTARTRQMVLAALGVVKVATAEQIRQLMCPGTASAQTVRNGCLDLGRDGLVESPGSAGRTNANGNLGLREAVEPDRPRAGGRGRGIGPAGAGDGRHRPRRRALGCQARGEGHRHPFMATGPTVPPAAPHTPLVWLSG